VAEIDATKTYGFVVFRLNRVVSQKGRIDDDQHEHTEKHLHAEQKKKKKKKKSNNKKDGG
jgi:hypothetical protein